MLEFLMLLSARFHAELFVEGADLARWAQSDPTINVAQRLTEMSTVLGHVLHTWGIVESQYGYLVAAPATWTPVGPAVDWLV